MTAKTTAKIFRKTFHKGQYKLFQCDNGGGLNGGEVQKAVEELGGKIINSAAYHPQTNSEVERPNGTLKQDIFVDIQNVAAEDVRWKERIPSK